MSYNWGTNWFYFIFVIRREKKNNILLEAILQSHSCEIGMTSLKQQRFCYLQCENESFTPCLFYHCHQKIPRCSLLSLLEIPQYSCLDHCWARVLPVCKTRMKWVTFQYQYKKQFINKKRNKKKRKISYSLL